MAYFPAISLSFKESVAFQLRQPSAAISFVKKAVVAWVRLRKLGGGPWGWRRPCCHEEERAWLR